MIIISQDENATYDLGKAFAVNANSEGEVHLVNYSGELAFLLGSYKSEERAKEIVAEIFALFDLQSRYSMPII